MHPQFSKVPTLNSPNPGSQMKTLSQETRMNSPVPSIAIGARRGSIESLDQSCQENTGELLIMLLKENMSLKKKNKELNKKMSLYEQIIFEDTKVAVSKASIMHA
jgi:hypothetical protein